METNNTTVTEDKAQVVQEFGTTLVQAVIAIIALVGSTKGVMTLLQ